MGELTVPDEFDDWPFDARRFVFAEANDAADLRGEIDGIVGLENDVDGSDSALQFTKEEAAALVMALGAPQEGPDGP